MIATDSASSHSSHLQSSSLEEEQHNERHRGDDDDDGLLDDILGRLSWASLSVPAPKGETKEEIMKQEQDNNLEDPPRLEWSEEGMTLKEANQSGLIEHLTTSLGSCMTPDFRLWIYGRVLFSLSLLYAANALGSMAGASTTACLCCQR